MLKSRRALSRSVVALAASIVLSAGACDKKPAAETHGMPPLDPQAAVVPSPRTRAEHPPVAGEQAMPPGHPGMPGAAGMPGMGGNPHGAGMPANPHGGDPEQAMEAAAPGDIPFDAKTVIAGQLKLDGKVKDKVKAGDVIYLVARRAGEGGAPGPVVAVKRLEAASFPMTFQLDSRDAMMAGTRMEGPLVITARVDKDGDAMTKNPGDVTGTLAVKALPLAKAALVLDTVL